MRANIIYLSSNYSGILKQLHYARRFVKQGQLLFTLDTEAEISELQQAQDQLTQAQQVLADLIAKQRSSILQGIIAQQKQATADLAYAEVTLQRNKQLYRKAPLAKMQ